jgi:eukaryotic-like serine/threonine-protein kinase
MTDGPPIDGRYHLLERIGMGGMGRVWLADDEVLHRQVAVKEILLPEGLTVEELAEVRLRTLREARTAARLTHPNVVRVYDVLYAENRPWIVMEYVASRSLAQVIKEDRPLTPQETARVGIAVLDALIAAHAAGVLHRDIKPGNVLLANDGRVMLTDFGLATFDEIGMALTQSGIVHGSPQFISPERALDGTSSPASDMWSLGATLYAAVEGRSPYSRPTSYEILSALATADPDPMVAAGPLARVLNGLLRRDPAKRMKAEEMRARLERIVAEPEKGRRRSSRTPERMDLPSPRPASGDYRIPLDSIGVEDAVRPPIDWLPIDPPSPRHRFGPDNSPRESYDLPRAAADHRGSRLRFKQGALISSIAVAVLVLGGLAAHTEFSGAGPTTAQLGDLPPASSALATPSATGQPSAGQSASQPPNTGQPDGRPGGPGGRRPGPPPVQQPPANYPWRCRPVDPPGAQPVPTSTGAKVPSGFTSYTKAGSYRIAIPDNGWQLASSGANDCLYDPDDTRLIGVYQWTNPGTGPAGVLTAVNKLQTSFFDNGSLRLYDNMGVTQASCTLPCADWTYTYSDMDGVVLHVISRTFLEPSHVAFTVTWSTSDVEWSTQLTNETQVMASFVPLS